MRDIINIIESLNLSENELNPNVSEYNRKLRAADYKVSREEYATHSHMIGMVAPIVKALRNSSLNSHGFLNGEEGQKLMDMIELLDSLCVPLGLLEIKEAPKGLSLPKLG